ncbi:MAG: 50S ribosomal protein L6 [Nanoarchaeota archaeon]
MRHPYSQSISIPEGVSCEISNGNLKVSKSGVSLSRHLEIPGVLVKIESNEIVFSAKKSSKREISTIKSYVAHINNMFSGVDKEFVYSLESCNVHFPMTLKVEKDKLIINNFLGEKTPRSAVILPNVKVEVKGQKITVASRDKELAGQTAANIEKATIVRKRDRRVFQDGIFLVERAGELI